MHRSQDYHSHISNIRRSPSVLTDVPQYPQAHLAFKKTVYEEDDVVEGSYPPRHSHHMRHRNPEFRERVEVVEYEKEPECGGGEVIYEENFDVETDYPRRNRGGLELAKWKTFKH